MEVVEGDDLGPVFGHLWQVQALTELANIIGHCDDEDEDQVGGGVTFINSLWFVINVENIVDCKQLNLM